MKENLMTVKTALAAAGTALGACLGWKGVMLMAWAAVMALDYVTGTLAACKAGQWSSATAREGLWHKGGMIAVVLVAAITDWIMVVIAAYIPLGIQWPGILLPLVLAWYILTELGSVLENAAALGAKVPNWLIKLLKASADLVEAAGEETNRDTESEEGHEREGQ